MRASDRAYKQKIEKYLISLLKICFAPDNTTSRCEYDKRYLHGSRKKGSLALKVNNTFVDKWSGGYSNISPPTELDIYVGDLYDHKPNVSWRNQLPDGQLYVEFENPDFLAFVIAKIKGGSPGNWLAGQWQSHDRNSDPITFEIIKCEFVGDLDALESEALMAQLSHDFS